MADGYGVIRQVHLNGVDPDTGSIVPGWSVEVRDAVTGTLVPIFIPDSKYSPGNAQILIEAALESVRGVHSLGSAAPAAGA